MTLPDRDALRLRLFLTGLVSLSFFLQLGDAPLFDRAEGRTGAQVLALLAAGPGAWLDGARFAEGGPLATWLQMLSVQLFGAREWALRLPSAAAAAAWVLVLYRFAVPRLGARGASATVIYMACSLAVVLIGRSATGDALLNLWLSLSLFNLYAWSEGERPRHLYWGWFWAALAALTAGLLALLLPCLITALYLASHRRWAQLAQTLFTPVGWLLMGAVAGPWFLSQWMMAGGDALGHALLDGLLRVFTHAESPDSSPLYFLVTLPLVVLPFSTLALIALWRAGTDWREPLTRFSLIWFGTVLLLISIDGDTQPNHLLYGVPGLCLLMGRYRTTEIRRVWLMLPLCAFAALCVALPFIFNAYDPGERPFDVALVELGRSVLNDETYFSSAVVFAGVALVLSVLPALRARDALGVGGVVQAVFVATALAAAVGEIQQGPLRAAAEAAREQDVTLVEWEHHHPSLAFYRGEPVERRLPEPGEWVLVPLHRQDDLPPGLVTVMSAGGYRLARRPAD